MSYRCRSQQLLASLILDMKYEYMNLPRYTDVIIWMVRNPPTFFLPTLSKSLGTRITKYSYWQTWMQMEIDRYWKFTADKTAVG